MSRPMRVVPMTRDDANAYVDLLHRHNEPVEGYRYAFGAMKDGALVGVCICGRPNARLIDQYAELEVLRLVTDATPNACSFLYGVASRLGRLLGFDAVFTYILESEPGISLKAAGWVYCYTTKGGPRDRPSRRRKGKAPEEPKQLWAPAWCAPAIMTARKIARAA